MSQRTVLSLECSGWDTASGPMAYFPQRLTKPKNLKPSDRVIPKLFSKDGSRLIAEVITDGKCTGIAIWHLGANKCDLIRQQSPRPNNTTAFNNGLPKRLVVTAYALAPNSRDLVVSDCLGRLLLFNLQATHLDAVILRHHSHPGDTWLPNSRVRVSRLEFSNNPDDDIMLAIYANGVFYIVPEDTGYRPKPNSFNYRAPDVLCMAFNPKGCSIAYYSGARRCQLWLVYSGSESAVVIKEKGGNTMALPQGIQSLNYSQDGDWLACNCTYEIHLIDTHTLTCMYTVQLPKLPRHVGNGACYAGDYSVLAIAKCHRVVFEPGSRQIHLFVDYSFPDYYDFVQTARAEGLSAEEMVKEKYHLVSALGCSACVHSYYIKATPMLMDPTIASGEQRLFYQYMCIPDHHQLEIQPHPLWLDGPISNWTMSYDCKGMAFLQTENDEVNTLRLK